jgi:hypothetical protein
MIAKHIHDTVMSEPIIATNWRSLHRTDEVVIYWEDVKTTSHLHVKKNSIKTTCTKSGFRWYYDFKQSDFIVFGIPHSSMSDYVLNWHREFVVVCNLCILL